MQRYLFLFSNIYAPRKGLGEFVLLPFFVFGHLTVDILPTKLGTKFHSI